MKIEIRLDGHYEAARHIRAGLPGNDLLFYIVPLHPAYLPTGRQARRGLRGTLRSRGISTASCTLQADILVRHA